MRHAAEPILLLAHEDREKLPPREASRSSTGPAEPVYDPATSAKTFKEILIEKGTLAARFAEADIVVEGEYRVGLQEQLYIETNGVIAVPENGGVTRLRLAAVPVLRPQGARSVLARPAAGEGPRRPDGDRRRIRRQGGVPLDDRGARGAPRR